MDNNNNNQSLEQKLLTHYQNRIKIKQIYQDKQIQMLDVPEQLMRDKKPDSNIDVTVSTSYSLMKRELQTKGFSEFRFLGFGKQGLVVLAKHNSTNIRYAIKGIQIKDLEGNPSEDNIKQSDIEIEMLKKCRGSPYIINLIDHFEVDLFRFLILTECLGTLFDLILTKHENRLNEISAIKYAKDIAEGLHHAHKLGCVISDIKMENILIDYNGNAIVSDFGLAQNLSKKSGYGFGEYMGNLMYEAPECINPNEFSDYFLLYEKLNVQPKPQGKPSERSDAFSFGYLIFGMISGEKNINKPYEKHLPLTFLNDFKNFVYKKQLKEIIEGLTKFSPRERMPILDVLIILKGILSIEFSLDEKFNELIEGDTQELNQKFQNQIEFIQHYSNKFYPIMKNEFINSLKANKAQQDINNQIKLNQLEDLCQKYQINENNLSHQIQIKSEQVNQLTQKLKDQENNYNILKTQYQDQQSQFQKLKTNFQIKESNYIETITKLQKQVDQLNQQAQSNKPLNSLLQNQQQKELALIEKQKMNSNQNKQQIEAKSQNPTIYQSQEEVKIQFKNN